MKMKYLRQNGEKLGKICVLYKTCKQIPPCVKGSGRISEKSGANSPRRSRCSNYEKGELYYETTNN